MTDLGALVACVFWLWESALKVYFYFLGLRVKDICYPTGVCTQRGVVCECWVVLAQVPQWNVANDVVEDFDAGLEYGEAERILKSVQRGDTREYLVQ